MLKYRGLAFKLNILILLVSGLVLLCTLFLNYSSTRKLMTAETQDDIEIIGQMTAQNIENILISAETVTKTLSVLIGKRTPSQRRIQDSLFSVVQTHPEIFGASITFAPYAYDPKMKFYSPYAYREKEGVNFLNEFNGLKDYTQLPWYSLPAATKEPCWTEPYINKDIGNVMMITYSIPFFINADENKELKGIALVDISLDWLSSLLEEVNSFGMGYSLILSANGKILFSPKSVLLSEFICGQTFFEYADKIKSQAISDLGREILTGKKGIKYVNLEGIKKAGWFYYAPIGPSEWFLVVFFPDNKFREDLRNLNIEILLICVAGLLFLITLITTIVRKLTAPLKNLAYSVKIIGTGKLDTEITVIPTHDEAGILTRAFEEMRKSLISYIENLRKTTAEKESVETEIKIAAALQSSIIPLIDEKFRSELFEIYAKLVPARNVSGDFYDIFYLDNNKLAVVVADVSGKGVPAAFFMSIAKFAIKNVCSLTSQLSPAKVLQLANKLICDENPSCMFVTCYLAFYDIRSGELIYANAGHHNFLHIFSNGKIEIKGILKNKALGVIPDEAYSEGKVNLGSGEAIAIYTDGVVEAENKNFNQFGDDAVIEHFVLEGIENINQAGDSLVKKVLEFEENNRFDDITLLILKRK